MSTRADLLLRDLHQDEYLARIAWNGPQDKPFYQAVLISESLVGGVRGGAFVKVAVVSPDELARLEQVLAANAVAAAGAYAGGGPEYYAEVWHGQAEVSSFGLGDDARTAEIMRELAAALSETNRQQLEDVFTRLAVR